MFRHSRDNGSPHKLRRLALCVGIVLAVSASGCSNNAAALRAAQQRAARAEAQRDALEKRVTALEAQLASATSTPTASTPESVTPPATPPSKQTPKPVVTVRQFAFIKTVQVSHGPLVPPGVSSYVVTADYAQFLTGDAAAKAAAKAGEESPPPNDYYIINSNARLRGVRVAKGVTVTSINGAGASPESPVTWTFAQFVSKFGGASSEDAIRTVPYWLSIRNGVIVKIEEQYLP